MCREAGGGLVEEGSMEVSDRYGISEITATIQDPSTTGRSFHSSHRMAVSEVIFPGHPMTVREHFMYSGVLHLAQVRIDNVTHFRLTSLLLYGGSSIMQIGLYRITDR